MSSSHENPKVLYLEDDEALAHVTIRAFNRVNYDVIHFSDTESLKSALPNLNIQCALLDLKIGNESALPLVKTVKDHAAVPIVILSGYGTIRAAVQAMKLGAVDFLSKPCHIEDVIQAFQVKEAITDEESGGI